MPSTNPLLTPWSTPFGAPPFAAITPGHFKEAFEVGLSEQRAEINAIAGQEAAPSFDNTVAALERSGAILRRVGGVFFNLAGADTNDALQLIEREIAPVLARHRNAIFLNDRLFARIDALWRDRETLGLDAEQARVLERYHLAFVRSGAGLDPAAKTRLATIAERLATLGTSFGQNVLADEKGWSLALEGEADLDGLPPFVRAAAAQAARERGLDSGHVITLSRSLIEPFLQFSRRRDLREKAFRAWIARGEAGETDNRAIIAETLALRAEKARLLGYSNFAAYRLADTMAGTPEAVAELLHSVWTPARRRALDEQGELAALAAADGVNGPLAPWDWRFYAEQRLRRSFAVDESAIKPYLQLDRMIEAAFDTAARLFGLRFEERTDVPVYHPDVRAFAVTDTRGKEVGLFLGDYFARPSKRSGAWMSAYRGQEKLSAEVRPIIVNVMNFSKSAPGEPTLLSFDDARTLFHEFGHALHGLLSDVTYPMISGTNVSRDFVEFPSQLYEHWLEQPQVLRRFALHHETGEPIPEDLLAKLRASRNANQGFETVSYVSSALFDLAAHTDEAAGDADVAALEAAVLADIDMPQAIVMRHRPTHFQHVFAGDGYSSAYYSYLWSEVLDADGFGAFEAAGDIFDSALAARLKTHVYAAGNRQQPELAYRAFRGGDPDPRALLVKRGLVAAA
ncbi:MAG: M3 family metallopeptidase [Labrys sp. (in: a-proteobacteria)]